MANPFNGEKTTYVLIMAHVVKRQNKTKTTTKNGNVHEDLRCPFQLKKLGLNNQCWCYENLSRNGGITPN